MDITKTRRDEIVLLLHNLRLFKEAEKSDLEILAEMGQWKMYKNGDQIIEQNGMQNRAFLVISGSIGIYRDGFLMAHYEPGELFGEFSMMDGSAYSASARAEQDSELFCIDRPSFLMTMNQSQTFAAGIIKNLCMRLRRHL